MTHDLSYLGLLDGQIGRLYSISFVFFFQAEDGIRDGTVTGVQTCALPISPICGCSAHLDIARCRPTCGVICLLATWHRRSSRPRANTPNGSGRGSARSRARSEERRVGKECRCRWATYHYKKKNEGDKNVVV